MGTPRRRPDLPAEAATTQRETTTAVLDSKKADLAERLHEAEFELAIEATVSRLLGLAMARGVEELDPDE